MFSIKKLLKFGSVAILVTSSTLGIVFRCSGEIKQNQSENLESILNQEICSDSQVKATL